MTNTELVLILKFYVPRRIFVHSPLLKVATSDHELALVIGHELSHLLNGHLESRNQLKYMIAMAQLLLMSLVDPTGIYTFIFDFATWRLSYYLEAAHSRANEEEADELGIQIAAKACYDTTKGAEIFRKFADIEGHK